MFQERIFPQIRRVLLGLCLLLNNCALVFMIQSAGIENRVRAATVRRSPFNIRGRKESSLLAGDTGANAELSFADADVPEAILTEEAAF